MAAADNAPGIILAIVELIKLLRSIAAQRGMPVEELWAEAGTQTEQNKAEIAKFLQELH